MLNVNGVAINFDVQNLFSNVNLQFLPGNCYGIIGANGLRYILKNLLSTSLRSGIGIRI